MKKIALILAAAILLTACGGAPGTAGSEENTAAAESETTSAAMTFAPISVTTSATEATKEDLADLQPDPPYDFDVDTMVPSDFGDFFTGTYSVATSSYKLLEGDGYENEVFVISSDNEGPTVYVIAGIHGDEEAAWQAGKLLKKISIKCGKLYVIAPANRWGASAVPKTRYLDGKDPNRAFPGDPSGTNAQRFAYALYNDVKDKAPDFVFDLHEAVIVQEGRDYLGSSIIYSDMELFGDLIIDLVLASQEGEICTKPFNFYSPGPAGSINRTITEGLRIPVMTVETFRGYQMRDRISDQLDVVQYVLRSYGLVD
ncbi:MAG: succinylglutamate desuccinylase/aspartoacylase family protein [Lachnospiraceae bacterium]|nr:succinylglutamate desuccinylase/aspartoacylase family protein [Lachnospiraceae bacterium]